MLTINRATASALKADLEPCLANILHQGDLGESQYLQMVSWNAELNCWQDLYSLKPINDGEQVLYWTPLRWLKTHYREWVHVL